jgi:NarL family two-component system response regulator LiaR
MNDKRIRVLIVDDHPLLRVGAATYLAQCDAFEVVGDADKAEEALRLTRALSPDVITLDIRLAGERSGVWLAKQIRSEGLNVKILVLTNFLHEPYVRAMMEVGVDGYLLKDTAPSGIADAIKMVAGGRTVFSSSVSRRMVGGYLSSGAARGDAPDRLTAREVEVLQWATYEGTNRELADRLGISVKGIQQHLTSIYSKLGVQNRTEAVVKAARAGIIVVDDEQLLSVRDTNLQNPVG